MSDDIKNIELETARLRMERERLALDAEMRKRDMMVAASNAATTIKNAGPRAFSVLITLIKLGIGVTILGWAIYWLGIARGWQWCGFFEVCNF